MDKTSNFKIFDSIDSIYLKVKVKLELLTQEVEEAIFDP